MEDINILKEVSNTIDLAMSKLKKATYCRQNSIVITKLEESTMWIYNRIKELEINNI